MRVTPGTWQRVGFVVVIVLVTAGVRAASVGPQTMEHLARFESITDLSIGPETPWFASGVNGDGGTFAVVGADPFGTGPGTLLKDRSLRYSRFGYAWLGAVVAFGQDELILLGLSLVGFASLAGVIWIAFGLRERIGLWAWLLVANPALYIGAIGDSAEPFALLLLLGAFVAGRKAMGVGIAVVRPSYLLSRASHGREFTMGLVLAVIVRVLFSLHFGDGLWSGASNLAVPFAGIVEAPSLLGWGVVLAGVITAVIGVIRRDLSWVASGILAVSLAAVVYDTPTNAVRAAGMLPVLWALGPRMSRLEPIPASLPVGGASYPEG